MISLDLRYDFAILFFMRHMEPKTKNAGPDNRSERGISLKMPVGLIEDATAAAKAELMSVAAFIRRAVRQACDNHAATASRVIGKSRD